MVDDGPSREEMSWFRKTARQFRRDAEKVRRDAGGAPRWKLGAKKAGVKVVAGTAAVGGAAWSAASAAGRGAANQAKGAASNISFWILILGLVHYFLRIWIGFTEGLALVLVFSIAFCFAGCYALALKVERDRIAILIPVIAFLIWYFAFDAAFDTQFLLYYIASVVILMVIVGAITRGKAIAPELYGFIPVIFLFLDIGLLPFLVDSLNWPITPLVENLILFMPWWAFFGLLTLPSNATGSGTANGLIGLLKLVGILFIIFTFIAPTIPDVGYDSTASAIPQAAQFEEAQAKLRAGLPQQEHPFISNLACIFGGQYADVSGCVKERNEARELRHHCEEVEGIDPSDTFAYDECIKERKAQKENSAGQLEGAFDRFISEPIVFKLGVDERFFNDVVSLSLTEQPRYTAVLEFENPPQQQIGVELVCSFTKKGSKDSIPGVVEEAQRTVTAGQGKQNVVCSPDQPLETGKYSIFYNATLVGLESKSYLVRFFIGSQDAEAQVKTLDLIGKVEGGIDQFVESQSGKEFALLKFGFGNPVSYPIVNSDTANELALAVENNGPGEVVEITSHEIDFELGGFSASCGKGGKVLIPGDVKKGTDLIPQSCPITSYPADPVNSHGYGYTRETYEGTLVYDYRITLKEDIVINE